MYGRQEPTFRHAPQSESSDGGKAVELLRRGGIDLLPWQALVLGDWLAREGETWAAGTCGLSVPRQNGKTVVVAGRISWGMVAYGEWVIYTAHLQKTATETFEAVRAIFDTPALRPLVQEVKTALGREEIRLKSGGRIKFLARTRNGGRGQHGDLLIFDEGQTVDDDVVASFLPCLAASKNPQTIYAGTPPDEMGAGKVLRKLRESAHANAAGVAWAEWAVDKLEPAKHGDAELWAYANPSYGYLIKPTTVQNEFAQMAADKFARERLGWWADNVLREPPIDPAAWERCTVDKAPQGLICYGVKFAPDGSTVSLSVAVKPDDGPVFVEGIENRAMNAGTAWLVEWLMARRDKAAQIVIDGRSGSAALINRLIEHNMPPHTIIAPNTAQVIAAASGFKAAVLEGNIAHIEQPAMTAAVTLTRKRKIGTDGGWSFDSTEQGDATLAESAALAFWAVTTTKRRPGRKAVIW